MGINYGYCGSPSVSWKLQYSTGNVTSCSTGKMNVMLVRSIKEVIPAWYTASSGVPYDTIHAWIDLLSCDNSHIPDQASVSIQLTEQYRWRPKEVDVVAGNVINYNKPCSSMHKRRKVTRAEISVTLSGIGGVNCKQFEDSLVVAEAAILAVGDIELPPVIWTVNSYQHEGSLNDWHRYTVSAKATVDVPADYPDWSALSFSLSGLDSLITSTLTISSTQYFPDRDPVEVDLETIRQTLLTEASITSCNSSITISSSGYSSLIDFIQPII